MPDVLDGPLDYCYDECERHNHVGAQAVNLTAGIKLKRKVLYVQGSITMVIPTYTWQDAFSDASRPMTVFCIHGL